MGLVSAIMAPICQFLKSLSPNNWLILSASIFDKLGLCWREDIIPPTCALASSSIAPRLPKDGELTLDLGEDEQYQAMSVRKAKTPEAFREFARWVAQIAGLKLAEEAPAPKVRKRVKVAEQQEAAQ